MEVQYRKYLEESTKKILKIVSDSDVGEDEKRAIVEAFASELSNNVVNIKELHDCEPLLYETSSKFIDDKIESILSNKNASYRDIEDAIKLCQRQREIDAICKNKNWDLPKREKTDVDKCEEVLRKRLESTSIINKIIDEDRQIDNFVRKAQNNLDAKACDSMLELVSELDEDILYCKSKNIFLPPISNNDIKTIRKHITDLKEIAEKKEALCQSICDVDLRIHSMVSIQSPTSGQWQEVVELCQKQTEQLYECRRNEWPVPAIIRYGNPNEVADKYKHYLKMLSIDKQLSSERDSLFSNKQYKNFYLNCEKQKSNIETCSRNRWEVPMLTFSDPQSLLGTVHKEKSKKDRTRRIKGYFIKAGIVCTCILVLVSFGIYKYREGKVKIPFDSLYVRGKMVDDVYIELEDAGFKNITKRPDTSGWLESGRVMSVSIDNSDAFSKDRYKSSDAKIVITYSSEGRKYVTDLLTNMRTTEYTEVEKELKKEGFTNITVEEAVTSDKDKDKLTAALSFNGENYTNESCYLPTNVPIVISYYKFKIGIGNESSEFIGQNYETVVNSLQESGFINIQTQKILTGYSKGNSVVGVMVNNSDDYDSSEIFDPDVKIVVKYSSDDRVDITSTLKNWQTTNYNTLRSMLKTRGCNNITLAKTETYDVEKNGLVASVTLGNDSFIAGDCFIQTAASIKLEYYVLKIVIGGTSSDFKGKQYADIASQLKAKGFTNIHLLRANNLINGKINKEGAIKSFTINGNADFADSDCFYFDDNIEIVVNTFSNKGCEEITDIEN